MLEEFPWLNGEKENYELGYNKTDVYFEYNPIECSLIIGGKPVFDFKDSAKIKYILETNMVANPKVNGTGIEYTPHYDHKLQFTVNKGSDFIQFILKKQYEADQKVQVLYLPFNFVSHSINIWGTSLLSRICKETGNIEFILYGIDGKSCKQ